MPPLYQLTEDLAFPNPEFALEEPNGLVAVGGDLSPKRILEAYKHGIFPWFEKDGPILWWSPNPRAILYFDNLKISRSLKNVIHKNIFHITYDQVFHDVIKACSQPRKYARESWITDEMICAYAELHKLGYAHSVEVWHQEKLVGGLYGMIIGKIFCGESMFSTMNNASKIALVHLVEKLQKENFLFIDCQIMNPHLKSLGVQNISRHEFLKILKNSLAEV